MLEVLNQTKFHQTDILWKMAKVLQFRAITQHLLLLLYISNFTDETSAQPTSEKGPCFLFQVIASWNE